MTTLVSSVLSTAKTILQDLGNVTWSDATLLDYLNAGQREVLVHRKDANVANVALVLTKGAAQDLPQDAIELIAAHGNKDGAAITPVMREELDLHMPDWRTEKREAAKVLHYFTDAANPTRFYVFPPSPGGNQLDVSYSAIPASASLGGAITLSDIYANPLADYVVYRALSEDTAYAPGIEIAGGFLRMFLMSIKGESFTRPSYSRRPAEAS